MASNDVSRLAISRAYMFIAFATMILMSLVGIGLIASALLGSKDPPQFVVVLWCGALAWNWYVLLTIPYEIRFDSMSRLSFRSLARTLTVSPSAIRSIKPYGGAVGLSVLRHDGGKIRLLSQFTGFHEIVSRIKAQNPDVQIVGA